MASGVCQSVLSVLVFLLVELILLICMIPAYIKHKLTLLLYGQPGDILAPSAEAGFLTEKVKFSMVCWMVELSGKLNLTELQTHILSKCAEHREVFDKFHRIPILEHGSTVWRKNAGFQIERHVKEHPVVAESERHLKEILQENLIPNFLQNASPWIILLINTKEGNTVLLVVIHHSITDGVGSMNLFNQLLTDVPAAIPQRAISECGSLTNYLTWATSFLEYIKILLAEPVWLLGSGETKTAQNHCLCWNKTIPISELSVVRKELGETINSIICGVIWEAISQYIFIKGITAPKNMLRVEMPASLREDSNYKPEINVGIILIEIPLTENLSIEKRIQYFSKIVKRRKSSFSDLSLYLWRKKAYIASVHPGMLRELQHMISDSTCEMSNIPGPQDKVQLAARDVARMIFIPTALDKSGLSFGISSYNGELTVSIFDYPGIVDTELLMRLVDESLQQLIAQMTERQNLSLSHRKLPY